MTSRVLFAFAALSFLAPSPSSAELSPAEQMMVQSIDSEQARRASHGGAVRAGDEALAAGTVVRLTDADGLIALAERRGDVGTLRPIVGLRG